MIALILIAQIARFTVAVNPLTYHKPATLKGKIIITQIPLPIQYLKVKSSQQCALMPPINVRARPENKATKTEKKC
ncbi:hypothetical protein [Snodgrassella alvi]|uniref:hypothetical protein n=1 Tax=Snodgrassella alvi TaxID=1196083 RepID=UPI00117ADE87|nr:hypothetical protein [Snodgrassella alvi]